MRFEGAKAKAVPESANVLSPSTQEQVRFEGAKVKASPKSTNMHSPSTQETGASKIDDFIKDYEALQYRAIRGFTIRDCRKGIALLSVISRRAYGWSQLCEIIPTQMWLAYMRRGLLLQHCFALHMRTTTCIRLAVSADS